METRSKTKSAKTMAEPKEANSDLTNLTSALQGLVSNLAQKEQRTVNITKVTNQAFKPNKYVPSLTESLPPPPELPIYQQCYSLVNQK